MTKGVYARRDRRQLFVRHPDNPLLTAEDWPYNVNTVFNVGAVRLPDGETFAQPCPRPPSRGPPWKRAFLLGPT
ncbi:MAG: hypothetical protein O7A71_02425 [Chloroflexi bacterium]|nr:hypothetical protein [Chloroflexota bacterium]